MKFPQRVICNLSPLLIDSVSVRIQLLVVIPCCATVHSRYVKIPQTSFSILNNGRKDEKEIQNEVTVVNKDMWVPPVFVLFSLQLILNNSRNEGESRNWYLICYISQISEIFVKIYYNNRSKPSEKFRDTLVLILWCPTFLISFTKRQTLNDSIYYSHAQWVYSVDALCKWNAYQLVSD